MPSNEVVVNGWQKLEVSDSKFEPIYKQLLESATEVSEIGPEPLPDLGRKELIRIRMRAEELADTRGIDRSWTRAYLQLADAANNLDAFLARTEEHKKGHYIEAKEVF